MWKSYLIKIQKELYNCISLVNTWRIKCITHYHYWVIFLNSMLQLLSRLGVVSLNFLWLTAEISSCNLTASVCWWVFFFASVFKREYKCFLNFLIPWSLFLTEKNFLKLIEIFYTKALIIRSKRLIVSPFFDGKHLTI